MGVNACSRVTFFNNTLDAPEVEQIIELLSTIESSSSSLSCYLMLVMLKGGLSDEQVCKFAELIFMRHVPSSQFLGVSLSAVGDRLGAMPQSRAILYLDRYMDCVERLELEDCDDCNFQAAFPLIQRDEQKTRYYQLLERLNPAYYRVQPVPVDKLGAICSIFFTERGHLRTGDINGGLAERATMKRSFIIEEDIHRLEAIIRRTLDTSDVLE